MNVNPHKTLIPLCLNEASTFTYSFTVTALLNWTDQEPTFLVL